MAEPVQIVGAGLAGSLMALYLARRGKAVGLWERRSDMRLEKQAEGRSINLAISTRGLTALDRVGLTETVLAEAIAMPGRLIHDLQGNTSFQAYGQSGQAIQSISRRRLNELLLNAAQEAGVRCHFNARCRDVDLESGTITFDTPEGERNVASSLSIGADGVFSALRGKMQRSTRFDFEQHYVSHGYSELCIKANADGSFKMDKSALHIWPRHDFMLIALPNFDGSFTLTLFLRFERQEKGAWCYEDLQTGADLKRFFGEQFPDVLPLIDELESNFFEQPPAALCTVRCSPFHHGDKVVLLGDAAHAVVPFYGQGMNAAFESARLLDDILAGQSQGPALAEFSRSRIPDALAIRQLALDHFADMSSSTADDLFLHARALELHLENAIPGYQSLYSMISFSNMPYAEAVAKAQHQGRQLARMGEMVQH
jgi:kynurenine 3-monooxygenase